ncbi:MAG: response regulator [Gemmataceae bacterium]|nr:response regulator [Gemmataceae bacterium]
MPDKPRILIAEDHPESVELLEAYLDALDCDFAVAKDGEETLRQLKSFKPDVLLLDVMMPKISGFEVCKRLKADPATQDIVVLMVTALDQHHDIDKAVEAGTNDFLTKPINKKELLVRVKSALKCRQHKGPLEQTLAYIDGVQAGWQ